MDALFSFGDLDGERIIEACDRATWLLGDARKAREAVGRAASKVLLAATKQEDHRKRSIRYQCRGKEGHRASNQAYLNLHQIFDFLVMTELLIEEKRQEKAGYRLSVEERIKRSVKHLIMVSIDHDSSWATVGVCRILCNYKPKEVERLYSVIAPNRALTKGDSHYCRVRGNLLEHISGRFGVEPGLFTDDGSEAIPPADGRVQLIKECFDRFRPSHNSFVVPKGYRWRPSDPPLLPYDDDGPRGDERVEVDRMCILFWPSNFNRIAESQNLNPFESSVRSLNFWAGASRWAGWNLA